LDTSWLNTAVPVALVGGYLIFKRLGQLKPSEAHQLVKNGARLIDVRSPGEFSSGHLDGAVNVPLQELGAKAATLGPKDKPLVLYCASGTRSSMGRNVLKGLGFSQVHNLGAMSRW
jgi:rhodanese-related sulfurtransferase